jgi:hypothetical protein
MNQSAMKARIVGGSLLAGALLLPWLAAGCTQESHNHQAKPSATAGDSNGQANRAAAIKAERDKLPAEDRKLVDAQEFCAVQENSRLGSMGAPFKVILKGQPVYLCCKHCKDEAEADPEKTLARVNELKANSGR